MPSKPILSSIPVNYPVRTIVGLSDSSDVPKHGPMMTELFRKAEAQLQQLNKKRKVQSPKLSVDSQRLLHELQVHQVELEMQNVELQEARDKMEVLLEKYTDLYDFAPIGYFSLNEQGRILEVNLSGATLLGVKRSLLINQFLPHYASPVSRPDFLNFLERIFAGVEKQTCEVTMQRKDGNSFFADFHGSFASSDLGKGKWCRVAVADISAHKRAEEAQHRADATEASNEKLRQEITRREVVEESLRKSEQHQVRMLNQSRLMQEQLRNLSRQVLNAQEQERKRISRELHDVIAQTLTSINLSVAALQKNADSNPKVFDRHLAHTQRLIAKSVLIVHEFARELRPAALDDLGLIPALQAFVKKFTAQTGLPVQVTAFAGVEQLETSHRTVLFRVAQEALTNVNRHAKASSVELCIEKLPDSISLRINDNGKSFPVERELNSNGSRRLGLLGMRERVEMVGGTFSIESTLGKGTTVQVKIPRSKVLLPRKKNPLTSRTD